MTFVGEPVQNRRTANWTLPVVRKAAGPDGEVLGFIEGALQLAYFERLYQEVDLGPEGAVSLFRQDGILLARYPRAEPSIGKTFAPGGMFARLKASGMAGLVVQQSSQIDGQQRLIAAHALQHYPVVVTVSTSVSWILAEWRTQTAYLVVAAIILEAAIASVGMLMLRQLRGQHLLHEARATRAEAVAGRRGAEAELLLAYRQERISRELSMQNVRFKAALSSMSQALCMFDADDRLVVGNGRLAEMFGLPAAAIASGITIEAMRGLIVGGSSLCPVDADAMYRSVLHMKVEGKRTAHVRELSDGRALAVNFSPIEGDGWMVTLEDITDRRQVEARIVHMAHHDALTGLPNRVLFHDRLTEAMARSRRGEPFAVLCLDLDHFKAVNDTLGHPVGDALLREVTRRLDSQIRETDTIARLGGDEFAIVQSSVDQPQDATMLATRLIETLGAPYDLDGHQVIVGTSIGIAVVPGDGDDPDQLLKNADLALYRAKADGRGCYRFFEPDMDERMQARRTLELDLRRALVEEEFEVFYQPLVNLKTRALTGFEALLRWIHPQRGLVSPADFVPLAEEIGLIVPLGEWVLRRACADAAGWPGAPKVAVNLSPVQFGSRTLVEDVAAALAASGLDPARLELEITETVMLADTDAVLVILHRLRDLGIGIAMDDFGTGYSSLSYLRRFPFSKVKIDQSFVQGLGQGGDCDTIIAAVADLCKQLGMITTAEGVETEDQLARLAAGNCTEVQGYLFSKPRPANEVAALCAKFGEPALLEITAS
jgi:diguanylate cyclase (GGDEF)-like protein